MISFFVQSRQESPLMSNLTKVTVIVPHNHWLNLNLRELWDYRELLLFLAWRNISVRYKQSIIGIGWAVFQPVVSMVVFSVIFGNFLGVDSDGKPFAPFVLAALVPWRYFSTVLLQGSTSLVQNAPLITKVYFPRIILPLVAVIDGLVDLAIAMGILIIVMVIFKVTLSLKILLLPFFILLAMMTALAVSFWASAINVRYRDVGQAMPFIIQIWMYLSPVVYSASVIPSEFDLFFRLNPLTTVIDGFRWVLLDTPAPDVGPMLFGIAMVGIIFCSGLVYFNITQRAFADII